MFSISAASIMSVFFSWASVALRNDTAALYALVINASVGFHVLLFSCRLVIFVASSLASRTLCAIGPEINKADSYFTTINCFALRSPRPVFRSTRVRRNECLMYAQKPG